MGLYISGLEMPTSCAKCLLFGEYGCPFIGSVGKALTEGRRSENCPLITIPSHGRLIDGDAFEDFIRNAWDKNDHWIADFVYSRPTIIPSDKEGGD